jgi:thiol-disulfide isomerase/thioredoxin
MKLHTISAFLLSVVSVAQRLARLLRRPSRNGVIALSLHTAPPAATRKAAPAFEFTALDGRRFDSAGLRGKVIVANFWFTGCGPRKAEIPDLNRLAAGFRGKDVVFLAFSNDEDPDLLRRFLKDNRFDYTVVPNAGKIASQFGVESYPSHAIVGKDGTLESFLMGAGEHRAEQLKTVITRLLE